MLKDPYPASLPRHKILGRVLTDDWHFLKRLFPQQVGLQDRVISILFKALLDELRRIHAITPLEQAWYVDSESYVVLERVLGNVNFERRVQGAAIGEPAGQASPRYDADGTGGVREEVRGAEEQRPVPQSRPQVRSPKPRRRGKKSTSKEEV